MTAFSEMSHFKSLHFSRRYWVFFVSIWVAGTAFGLDEKPSTKALSNTQALEHKIQEQPQDSKSALELAQLYFTEKNYAKIPPLLWKHIDILRKKDFHILLRSHLELSQGEDLLRLANLLVSKNPKDFEAFHFQGKGYLLKKKEKEALGSFKKATEINPKYLPSYLSIAEIYEKKKNLYELRALYMDMLNVFGPWADILTKLCQINTEDGLNDVAEKHCSEAVQKDPKNVSNLVNLGVIAIQLGDRPKGIERLKSATDKFPKSEVALYSYGKVLEEDKNYIDSYKVFKSCVSHDDKSDRCWVGFSNAAFQLQKLDEAHDGYKGLCKKNRSFGVHVRRAVASLRASGQKDHLQKFQDLADFCAL